MNAEVDNTQHTNRTSKLIGSGVAVLSHLLLLFFLVTTGFRTIYPIPPDQGILVEFLPDEFPPMLPRAVPGEEPRALNPDPTQEVRLVQQAIHTEVMPSNVRTQPSTL